jgi:unsaturated rhamnogalacturonyl hydrolase
MTRTLIVCLLTLSTLTAGEAPRAWTSVADHLVQTPVESYAFNWGEGVQMMGLMRAAVVERNSRYIDYVERWARIYEAWDLQTLLHATPDATAGPRSLGYCGHWSPGSAVLYLYRERPKPEHLTLARGVTEFIRTAAERSPEGGLGHWQGSHQLWDDTLYMACPLLARMGELEKKPALIEDAADQLIIYSHHLQEERTGLFYHMWDWQTGKHSEGFWGRGNGWVLMSLAETMEVMPKTGPKFQELTRFARKLAAGLAATQDSSGLWHTVLDDPKSVPESSATAMFSYGLLKLVRLRILPPDSVSMALAAWKAINDRYVRNGVVTGVSAGTGPQGVKAYLTIPMGSETWGTGAYLLAASEVTLKRR